MDTETQESEGNGGAVKIGEDQLQRWQELMKYYEKYTGLYNNLASEGKEIEAVSHLSNIRNELRRLSEKVKRKVKHQVKIYRNYFQINENDSEEVRDIYEHIREQIDKAFPFSVKGNPLGISEERLTELVLKFCELKESSRSLEIQWYTDKSDSYKDNWGGLPYTNTIDAFTYTIYRDKEELEGYFLQLEVVESIIETAIYSNYPDKLNKRIIREFESEKNKNKGGRPIHVDEDDIEEVITDWIIRARKGEEGFKRLLWDTKKREGQVHYSKVARKLIRSEGVEFIDENTYRNDKVLADKVSSIVKRKGI